MKAIIHDYYTEIFLAKEEAMELCKMGQGADCCVWLAVGPKGFECLYHNRRGITLTGETLEGRWQAGKTVAKRDGCDKVKNFSALGKSGVISF